MPEYTIFATLLSCRAAHLHREAINETEDFVLLRVPVAAKFVARRVQSAK